MYAIEVCREKTLEACPAGNDAKWVPLDQWLNIDEDEEDTE